MAYDTSKVTLVSGIVANEVSDDYVITLLELENSVWLGVTFGAWFKIGMAIALFLLVIERVVNIVKKIKENK